MYQIRNMLGDGLLECTVTLTRRIDIEPCSEARTDEFPGSVISEMDSVDQGAKMVTSEVALDPSATKSVTEAVVGEACSVCAHPMRVHDDIGTRFCAATSAGTLTRGCVCRPDG